MTNQTSIKCVDLLENGQVDLIFINHPNMHISNLSAMKRIKTFRDVFVANDSFSHLKGKKLSFRELLDQPILMLDRKSTTSEFLHNLFQKYQLDLVPEIELSSNDLLIDLARIGLGIAFIPDYCLEKDSSGLFVVETKEELPERQILVAYNDRIPMPKSVKTFLEYF